MKTYTCIECGVVKKFHYGAKATNTCCSPECAGITKFKLTTLPRFTEGLVSERATIRKCIRHVSGYECAVCSLSEWQDKPITLVVDHIDGDASNNLPSNLRLICPNCNSQTDTFGGRNKGNGRKARGLKLN